MNLATESGQLRGVVVVALEQDHGAGFKASEGAPLAARKPRSRDSDAEQLTSGQRLDHVPTDFGTVEPRRLGGFSSAHAS